MTLPAPLRRLLALLALLACLACAALAHPMPTSVLQLDVHAHEVSAELQLPLGQLQLAIPAVLPPAVLTADAQGLLRTYSPALRRYLLAHVRATSPDGQAWQVGVGTLVIGAAEQSYTGPYRELTAALTLTPPQGESDRTFSLHYDAVIHQVVTHSALVSVRQDWAAGVVGEHALQVGVVRLDVPSNTVPPLQVNLTPGSAWRGFQGIFALGMSHIREGTDHLLFLLTLLLPAPLLVANRRWAGPGTVRQSVRQLVRIVTAFTVGHSLTLLLGTVGLIRPPDAPIEVLIAVSILVSAVHALRPVFPGKEMLIAAGFGLVHGMAFSYTLAELHLSPWQTALSLLGFNLGIETMQLFVVLLVMPWLLLLSRTPLYPVIRIVGATFAGVAAVAWIMERVSGRANSVTGWVEEVAHQAPWIMLALALLALGATRWSRSQARRTLSAA